MTIVKSSQGVLYSFAKRDLALAFVAAELVRHPEVFPVENADGEITFMDKLSSSSVVAQLMKG